MSTADLRILPAGAVAPPKLVALQYLTEGTASSSSNVWKKVREGKLPAPLIRSPRYTRWGKAEIDAYLSDPQTWLALNARSEA